MSQSIPAIGNYELHNVRRLVNEYVLERGLTLAAGGVPLHMRRAEPADFKVVEHLFDEAKVRLKSLGTDQWSNDWRDEAGRRRMDRVRYSIEKRTCWLGEFKIPLDTAVAIFPVATVSIESRGSTKVWKREEQKGVRAVYVSRLVVANEFASIDLGASVIDWAARRGLQQRDARLIRVDAWTSNVALHNYYLNRGFKDCGEVDDKEYPSRRRFERSTIYDSRLARPVA